MDPTGRRRRYITINPRSNVSFAGPPDAGLSHSKPSRTDDGRLGGRGRLGVLLRRPRGVCPRLSVRRSQRVILPPDSRSHRTTVAIPRARRLRLRDQIESGHHPHRSTSGLGAGPGAANVYQFDDTELRAIDRASGDAVRAALTFHGVRMYTDAARFLAFKRTGIFPPATSARGPASLEEVLRPDARFPATREELQREHGWKVIDLDDRTRVHAALLIENLPSRGYVSVADVLSEIEIPVSQAARSSPERAHPGPKYPQNRPQNPVVALTTIRLLSSRELPLDNSVRSHVPLRN